jgi:hypothetical protein
MFEGKAQVYPIDRGAPLLGKLHASLTNIRLAGKVYKRQAVKVITNIYK